MATATSSRPEPIHQPAGLNDGRYGNEHSWIAAVPNSSFQIDLGKLATIGRVKLGRDRTGHFTDRAMDYLKIELSTDGRRWQSVFEKRGVGAVEGYAPAQTLEITIAPVQARHIRGAVDPVDACIDEFEVYAPRQGNAGILPHIAVVESRKLLRRPVARTTLRATAKAARWDAGKEVLELVIENTGPMTALFCEPHPLIEYRTDLLIDNNHCFIPPGQSRTITIRAAPCPPLPLGEGQGGLMKTGTGYPLGAATDCSITGSEPRPVAVPVPVLTGFSSGQGQGVRAVGSLPLSQTGWRIRCWNADHVVIEPRGQVLLAAGRRDAIVNPMGNFYECLKSRHTPISDVVSQHRSVSVCHLANISMRLGRKLTWDPEKDRFVGDDAANGSLQRQQRNGYRIEI